MPYHARYAVFSGANSLRTSSQIPVNDRSMGQLTKLVRPAAALSNQSPINTVLFRAPFGPSSLLKRNRHPIQEPLSVSVGRGFGPSGHHIVHNSSPISSWTPGNVTVQMIFSLQRRTTNRLVRHCLLFKPISTPTFTILGRLRPKRRF